MDTHKPRTVSINDFIQWKKNKELILQPRFQRRKVWVPKAKSFLIDTILIGFPIPTIHIRSNIDLYTQKTIREVIDGQQRISTILDYIEGKFTVLSMHNKEYGGKKFSELPEEIKKRFLEYDLSVDFLIGADDSDVLDVFSRINSYTVVLNTQEKLNANFSGKFKQAVYELGRIHYNFWRNNKILNDYSILRMKEAELCTDILIAINSGIQGKYNLKEYKNYYEKYDDDFPKERTIKERFKNCIDTIENIFEGKLYKSLFGKKTLFYSLFCALYDVMYGIPDSILENHFKIKKENYEDIRKALLKLENELTNEEVTDIKYQKFVNAYKLHTTSKSNRLERCKVILSEIIQVLK